jgi:hypothetical protein
MDSDLRQKGRPVCKFGPGGDFVSYWPTQDYLNLQISETRLGKMLDLFSEAAAILLGSSLEIPYTSGIRTAGTGNDEPARPISPPLIAVVKNGQRILHQPMLFTDNRHKDMHRPKHRIRSYQKFTKKKASYERPAQGSLFETNLQGAKIA